MPAGTGGGADQMARLLQGVITKNNLMKQPLIVVNKSGGAGAEGFLAVKDAKGDPHKLVITLSNLFTTPLATGVPFNWKDLTPVAMLALDQFVLWVNAETPYKTAKDYIDGGQGGRANQDSRWAEPAPSRRTRSSPSRSRSRPASRFIYVPFKGGGDVAVQLVGKHVDSTVNNPIEAVAQWRAGQLRPLCVFDSQRMPYKAKVTDTMSWNDIPTCKDAGRADRVPDAARHLHARRRDQGAGRLLRRPVQEGARNAEWKKFMEDGAFNADVHDRRRVREVGRASGKHPSRPDEGSRVPRQALDNSQSRPRANPARSCVSVTRQKSRRAGTSRPRSDLTDSP